MNDRAGEPDVAKALEEAVAESALPWTRVAAVAGVGTNAISRFRQRQVRTINSSALLRLMAGVPGFAERLGFREVSDHAA